ncbi:MFS transporter small subunit [Nocardioides donggukensis]
MTARIVTAWAVVGIPLAYGVFETLRRTASLFGG